MSKEFMHDNALKNTLSIGAALKFGRMALGEIDLYPRFEGSKEWDTGAGQIILKESGHYMIDLKTQKEPIYNKPSIKNNYFIALKSSIDFKNFKYPVFS